MKINDNETLVKIVAGRKTTEGFERIESEAFPRPQEEMTEEEMKNKFENKDGIYAVRLTTHFLVS